MNDLFIQGLTIDWNRVRPYNYVRQIPAISGIDTFVNNRQHFLNQLLNEET